MKHIATSKGPSGHVYTFFDDGPFEDCVARTVRRSEADRFNRTFAPELTSEMDAALQRFERNPQFTVHWVPQRRQSAEVRFVPVLAP